VGKRAQIAAAALVLGLILPFLGKPVHVDDANFLRLAEGAARDPWRPHAIDINWLGVTQRAYDVLSNPPGIAWWLCPVRNAPEWVQHAWMLPWVGLALLGVRRLGAALGSDGVAALLVLGTSPVVILSAQALTPDAPLLACVVLGVGGFLTARERAWPWALLAGCAALFRYSGFCMIPLLLLAGYQRKRLAEALPVALPPAALCLHDLHAYGSLHVLTMVGFQSVAFAPVLMLRKGVAMLAMLGGAGMLPLLPWRRRAGPILAILGAVLGLLASLSSGHTLAQMAPTVAFTAAGAVSLGAFRLRDDADRLLAAWFFGGFLFQLALGFAATRYWLPFLPALVLAALRLGPSRRLLAGAVAASAVVSAGMALDDDAFARALRDAARSVAPRGPGVFSGHWGWQHYLEKEGWRPLEAGTAPRSIFAVSWATWPQVPAADACLDLVEDRTLPYRGTGLRVHTASGAANYHSSGVSPPRGAPVDTYAPWTFSREPFDHVTLFRPCAP
jgi:hypothetical protein